MAEKHAKQKCKTEPLSVDSDSNGGSSASSLPSTPAAVSNTSLNLPSVEKLVLRSPFPTRPVPCYPTLSTYGFMYLTPVNLMSPVGVIGQKTFSFNDDLFDQPQSVPLDLSQRSSRSKKESCGSVVDYSATVIPKPFDFSHSTKNVQGYVN